MKDFVKQCLPCTSFTDKKTSEPVKAHESPIKCWETVAADLFVPLPSLKHIRVVKVWASRSLAAKLVISASSH